jgi:hypothetical protein
VLPIDAARTAQQQILSALLNTEHPYRCFPYETVLFYLLFRHSANASRGAQWRLVTSSDITKGKSGKW